MQRENASLRWIYDNRTHNKMLFAICLSRLSMRQHDRATALKMRKLHCR